LAPAGSINAAFGGAKKIIVVQDDPAVRSHVATMQKQLPVLRGVEVIDDNAAVATSLAGRTAIVYGTPEHAWLTKHQARLPFRFRENVVEIDSRRFSGTRLRVICAVRNPEDLQQRAIIYVAQTAKDVIGINAPRHGPTEWIVFDGERTLAAGNFPIPPEKLHADLEELTALIGRVHPATADGPTPALKAAIARARSELKTPLRREQFWVVLGRVVQSLRDAHTSVDPPFSGQELDLPFSWLSDGLIVTEDSAWLRKGDRMVRLGSHTEPQLLEVLRGVIPAENDHWVRHRGESILKDLLLLRAMGIATEAPVTVVVERDGRQSEIPVPLRIAYRPAKPPLWVRFEIDEKHNLAVFGLDRCDNNEQYRKTLKEFFAVVQEKKITRVAVDLRRNAGGNSAVVDEFLRYLDVDRYTRFGMELRNSAEARAQRTDLALFGWIGQNKREPTKVKNPRVKQPFHGELYVLTSKTTFSSGNWFAVIVRDNQLGKVVGEPTGNAPSSYGDRLAFTLSNSGLAYGISYKYWRRPDPKRDPAGSIVPDRLIPTTREHIIAGTDPVRGFLRNPRQATTQ
jgi:hypothetical protein